MIAYDVTISSHASVFAGMPGRPKLSAAGLELGIPQSTASRPIAEAERSIGPPAVRQHARRWILDRLRLGEFLSRIALCMASSRKQK